MLEKERVPRRPQVQAAVKPLLDPATMTQNIRQFMEGFLAVCLDFQSFAVIPIFDFELSANCAVALIFGAVDL